jgi:UDP-N-acetylmuramate--alanine ligase
MAILNKTQDAEPVKQHIHFVGIGGSGMSGIAEVLLNSGYVISGSDTSHSANVQRLIALGAQVFLTHAAENLKDVDILVVSSAIAEDNPEVAAARLARIPVVPRAQMLAELMRTRDGIAIAGTHGKTTTTSLVTSLLSEGGLDPTFVIGGVLNSAGTNARLGASNYFVAEADESDASFLYLKPQMAVVTNIDADHTWFYSNNFENIRKTFVDFLHHLPLSGLAVLCADDPGVQSILDQVARPLKTYGFSADADVCARHFEQQGVRSYFTASFPNHPAIEIELNLPGQHNVLNALAAMTLALEIGVAPHAIQAALKGFQGIGRRFQIKGELGFGKGRALLIDDYGHHPREMSATLEAIRLAWPTRRIVMAFQPHRYTRTLALFEDFAQVLSSVDKLVLLDIYAAGEALIPGADGRSLCHSIRQRGRVDPIFLPRGEPLADVLVDILADGDILLMQGAGDIGMMAAKLVEQWGGRTT